MEVTLAIPADIALGRLNAERGVTTAALVRKHLAGTTGALVTDVLTGLVTIIIVRALSASATGAAIATERRVPTTADIALDKTRLALAIVALAAIGVVTIAIV